MAGHVFQRGRTWSFKADAGKDPRTGRRKQVMKGGFSSKPVAERAMVGLMADVQRGQYIPPNKQSLGQFLTEWLKSVQHSLAPRSYESYEAHIRNYIIPNLGGISLKDLTHNHINKMYGELLRRRLSPKTVKGTHIVLRRALRDAGLASNPAALASSPRVSKRPHTIWDEATLKRFLDLAKDHQDYLAWLLLATTGMRRNEVLFLRWKDLDLEKGNVWVESGKTAASSRSIHLDYHTTMLLREYRKTRMFSEMVFPDVRPSTFSERFRARVEAWELPRIRLHDLRHTHATLLLKSGVHPKVVQERLGHANIGMTLDTYSHVVAGMDEGAADLFGDIIWTQDRAT